MTISRIQGPVPQPAFRRPDCGAPVTTAAVGMVNCPLPNGVWQPTSIPDLEDKS